jgi:hypothetical protein
MNGFDPFKDIEYVIAGFAAICIGVGAFVTWLIMRL